MSLSKIAAKLLPSHSRQHECPKKERAFLIWDNYFRLGLEVMRLNVSRCGFARDSHEMDNPASRAQNLAANAICAN